MADDPNTTEPASNGFGRARRRPVSITAERLVTRSFLPAHDGFPLVIQPAVENLNLAVWAGNNRQLVEQELLACGAILFRGFKVETVEQFEAVARAVSPQLLDYLERSSPRTEVSKSIYTSTDYPADQPIHFHNEQSYTKSWPMKLWFYCLKAAEQGGATPIADGRKVLRLIAPELRERFLRRKVMYVRNYGDGIGLSWQTAFQTTSPSELEDYCRRSAIDFEWMGHNRLRTRQIFDTIVTHPKTNEAVWFEHAAFFHVSAIEPAMREALLAEYKEEDLPFNTYYGDNTPIEDSVLEQIRAAYRQAAVSFPWQEGDLLLIDNMLTSHGRESFVGQRKIIVAMAELWPVRNNQ